MRIEEDEPAPRTASAGKTKKKKNKRHIHIGPNVRAFRAGRALCPMCDAEKALRLTETERESERAAKEAQRASRRS